MSVTPFRFVHASDLHLEQPLYGIDSVPDHLRDLFLEAPYDSARRAFDIALAEDVDFVVLAGDILHPDTGGRRGMTLLAEQLTRVADRGIVVYWLAGNVDSAVARRWPGSIELPSSVQFLGRHGQQRVIHRREGHPLATIESVAWEGQRAVRPDGGSQAPSDLPVVAVSYTDGDVEALAAAEELGEAGVEYWAVGGPHGACTVESTGAVIRCSGTHQGRCPMECDPHGVTVVDIDHDRTVSTEMFPVDVMRWQTERVDVKGDASLKDVKELLRGRTESLVQRDPDRYWLLSWTLVVDDSWEARSRGKYPTGDLLNWMRSELWSSMPTTWAVSLSLQSETTSAIPSEWYEEESILGDYLRSVRAFAEDGNQPLPLNQFLEEVQRESTLARTLGVTDGRARRQVLDDALRLGCLLLRGGDDPRIGRCEIEIHQASS